jgi:hypothetical protein
MLTVHVRVNDAATGKPMPVRLRVLDRDGNYYAPLGRLTEFAAEPGADVGGSVRLGETRWAYIDGACEVRLPPGPLRVEASRGPEYLPLRRELTLGPGQISLRLAAERWTDPRPEGWYSGDVRCHGLAPHAALLEGAAEGLALVHLLARERPPDAGRPGAFSNLLAFSGSRPALEGPDCAVVVNTLNEHPVLGSVALLNCHRAVFPLRFGGPDYSDDWSVADWCDQCHRKRGLVVWPDLPRLTAQHPQGEALAALLLGQVDAFEIASFPSAAPPALEDWYGLLNCGCRPALVGGSGKDSNATALGAVRTYARLLPGQEPGVGPWVEAVRAGRAFVTNGPLIFLSVDGVGPGEALPLPAGGRAVRVRAEARSATPFDRLEVVIGGEVAADTATSGDHRNAVLETELPLREPAWVAARCRSLGRQTDGPCAFAHTSPVRVEVEGRPWRAAAACAAALHEVLERTRAWVAHEARCPAERQRQRLEGVLDAAARELRRRQGE